MITVQGEARLPQAVVGASRAHFGTSRDDNFPKNAKPSSLSLVSFKPHHEAHEACIANIKWAGFDRDDNVLIIDLLGPSLEDLFVYYGRRLSLKTVLMLADHMIKALDVHLDQFEPRYPGRSSKTWKSVN